MVRKLSTVLIAVAALAAGPGALAAELSIAVVDVQAAIGQTQEAQVFLERVQGELQADQERIRELQAEKTRIEERVERDSEVMSEEERVRLSEEYDRITSDLQYRAETYQKAVNRRRNELFRQMGPRVEAALDDLVQLEGYDLVVPRNSVIYVNPKHDITRRLTEQLDAKD
jgi:Skp family chaperone for outer membrane proteins